MAYLINRTLTKLLKGQPPYEVLYKGKPFYNGIWIFGTLCFTQTTQYWRI